MKIERGRALMMSCNNFELGTPPPQPRVLQMQVTEHRLEDLQQFLKHMSSGGGSLKILRGRGRKIWGEGGLPLKNSSVLAHLFTASGQFCYFS